MGLYDSKLSCWQRHQLRLPQDNCGDVCIDTVLAEQAALAAEETPVVPPVDPTPVKPVYTRGAAKHVENATNEEK